MDKVKWLPMDSAPKDKMIIAIEGPLDEHSLSKFYQPGGGPNFFEWHNGWTIVGFRYCIRFPIAWIPIPFEIPEFTYEDYNRFRKAMGSKEGVEPPT